MKTNRFKNYLVPIMSISIFLMLIFGAGYAYFTATLSMNTSNYQLTLPKQTSLVCTKTDCNVTITPAMMAQTNSNTEVAKATSTCYLNCTCTGTQNAVCAYNVSLFETGDVYTPSPTLGGYKEFSVNITSPSGCTVQNTSNVETHVNTLRNKVVSSCSLTVPAGGSVSANISAEFKWYNIPYNQTSHALKTYQYQLTNNSEATEQEEEQGDIAYYYCGIRTNDDYTTECPSIGDTVNINDYDSDVSGFTRNSYTKQGVRNNKVVEAYSCVKYIKSSNTIERCVQYSSDGSSYGSYTSMSSSTVSSVNNPSGNIKVLNDMRLDGGFTCTFSSTESECHDQYYDHEIRVYSNGQVDSYDGSVRCEEGYYCWWD